MTLGIAVLALAGAVGGLVASTAIKSPAQVAAETKSPAATLLTAPVQRGVVSQTVLAQGVAAEPSEIRARRYSVPAAPWPAPARVHRSRS
jgi:hypothetical protein